MADSDTLNSLSTSVDEAFAMLVLGYLEGTATAEELAVLNAELAQSALRRQLFIEMCRLQSELTEAFSSQRKARGRRAKQLLEEPAKESSGEDTIMRAVSAEDTVHGTTTPTPGEPPPQE